MVNRHLLFGISGGLVLILDQLSKWVARGMEAPVRLWPFLQLKLRFNTGAAFSLLEGSQLILIILSVIIIAAIIYAHVRMYSCSIPLGLIIGGALGNLLDRIILGRVTDFIELSFWPTFNLADTAITVGALTIVVLYLRKDIKEKRG